MTRHDHPILKFRAGYRHLVAVLLSLFAISSVTASFQDLQILRSSSEHYLRAQLGVSQVEDDSIKISAGRLDHRLRLAQCTEKLEHYLPQGHRLQGRVSVGVRCMDPANRWSIFVPVSITQYAEIVVTREAVSRGEVLRAEQVQLEKRALTNLHNGYLQTLKQAVGQELKTSLPRGISLTPGHLKRQYAVKRGQIVNILAKNDVISVRSKGKALANGEIGQRIKVKNSHTNKIIEGTVGYNGIIEIRL